MKGGSRKAGIEPFADAMRELGSFAEQYSTIVIKANDVLKSDGQSHSIKNQSSSVIHHPSSTTSATRQRYKRDREEIRSNAIDVVEVTTNVKKSRMRQ